MRVLVTGSSGHLGEALVRTLRDLGHEVVGLDILPTPFTTLVGSITDRALVAKGMRYTQVVFHTATLHRPHISSHPRQHFVDTNITGTLNLLEEATAAAIESFVFTSTTSVFGNALVPPAEAPAAWITEEVRPIPRNIWCHQVGRRGPLRVVSQERKHFMHRAKNIAILSRGRLRRGSQRCLFERQHEGERIPVSASRP
jgi:nucleoside-diphosphate-sugar epimerase